MIERRIHGTKNSSSLESRKIGMVLPIKIESEPLTSSSTRFWCRCQVYWNNWRKPGLFVFFSHFGFEKDRVQCLRNGDSYWICRGTFPTHSGRAISRGVCCYLFGMYWLITHERGLPNLLDYRMLGRKNPRSLDCYGPKEKWRKRCLSLLKLT